MEARHFRRSRRRQLVIFLDLSIEPISLYFHIPFCTKKCPYCHFFVLPNAASLHDLLLKAFLLHFEKALPLIRKKKLISLYFGGGTPSLFPLSHFEKLFQKIEEHFSLENVEITLEANPENLTKKLLQSFVSLKINRLSLGVQSFDDTSLHILERTHSAKDAQEAIYKANEAGFKNISIDLMYDLPFQTKSSWQTSLNALAQLPITHLSLYNLTIEPHTPFFKRKDTLSFPSPQKSLWMLETACDVLESLSFSRYEISAFCRPGYASQHNIGYWQMRPFLGLGPSAFSYLKGTREKNISHLHRYLKALEEGKEPADFQETLPFPQNLKEKVAIGLRMAEGISLESISPLPEEISASLTRLAKENLLTLKEKKAVLTKRGKLFYDMVASELM